MDSKEKDQILLIQLLAIFQGAAMQHMGKMADPVTNQIGQDLGQAQFAIDMLEMLQARMKGNLDTEEEKIFTTVLQDLRLNYVDEVTKAQSTKKEEPPATAS
ncbi:MAG: DUF1844 domain-containing protein [Ignavibacteriae bacterium]|nr:DUF1844 domain-containing protein [Ignavibacteriota bacterium]